MEAPRALPVGRLHKDELRRALSLTRRYLRFGTRSTAELRTYLQARHVAERLIEAIIMDCSRDGQLDDRSCAKLWATHLGEQGYAWGTVRQRLLAKGLDAQLITQVLAPLQARADDATRARALARAHLAHRTSVQRAARGQDHRDRNRVGRLLAQRGFDSDLIDRVLTESFGPIPD